MSFKTTLGVAIAAGAMSLGSAALADNHGGGGPQDRALMMRDPSIHVYSF